MEATDEGDRALLTAFRAACLTQFALDVREGDAHLVSRDARGLRRLAHNLRSVLAVLGEPVASACASRLEDMLLGNDWPASEATWTVMRTHLLAQRD